MMQVAHPLPFLSASYNALSDSALADMEIAKLLVAFLQQQGVQPHHQLLEVECGHLLNAALIADYVQPRHYFATAEEDEALSIAYNQSLTDRQRENIPRSQLVASDGFDFNFLASRKMDYAVSLSLLTQHPLNRVRDDLQKLQSCMQPGGAFYASLFLCPDHHPIHQMMQHSSAGGVSGLVTSYATRTPYHYQLEDLEFCTRDTAWKCQLIGDWDHPHGQKMVAFIHQGG